MAGAPAGEDGGGIPPSTLPPRLPPSAYPEEDRVQAWRRESRRHIIPFERRGDEKPAEGMGRGEAMWQDGRK